MCQRKLRSRKRHPPLPFEIIHEQPMNYRPKRARRDHWLQPLTSLPKKKRYAGRARDTRRHTWIEE
jgi:hypothetical protein